MTVPRPKITKFSAIYLTRRPKFALWVSELIGPGQSDGKTQESVPIREIGKELLVTFHVKRWLQLR